MNLISVYTAAGKLEAEMVKAFLEAQGLNVILDQESLGRTMGLAAGRLGKVEVLVPQSAAAEARDFLSAIEAGDYENFGLNSELSEADSPDSEP